MFKTTMTAVAAVLVLPLAAAAQDQGVKGQWSVTVSGGASVPAGGEFHEGGAGTVLGLPTTVESRTSNDVFDTGVGWRAGAGYGITPRLELFGDFTWKRASAAELSVGDVAALDLRAAFGDYRSYGLDGGVRFHVSPDAPVNLYMAGLAGFRRVEAIPGTFSVPAAGVVLSEVPFFDDSVVPVVGGDIGVLFAVSPRVRLGLEAGLRYHSDLSGTEGLAGTGLENLNDAGDRWSVPVSAVFRIGF
jgi:hypothetical protein